MARLNVWALGMTFVTVLASVYLYNRFIAKAGSSIADFGKPVAK